MHECEQGSTNGHVWLCLPFSSLLSRLFFHSHHLSSSSLILPLFISTLHLCPTLHVPFLLLLLSIFALEHHSQDGVHGIELAILGGHTDIVEDMVRQYQADVRFKRQVRGQWFRMYTVTVCRYVYNMLYTYLHTITRHYSYDCNWLKLPGTFS